MKNLFEVKDIVRNLKNQPGQAIICIVVMALCIVISWTAFSLYYFSVLKKVDFSDADHWIGLVGNSQGFDSRFDNSIDSYSYQVLANNELGFEVFGAIQPGFSALSYGNETTRLNQAEVSPNIFAASELKTELGRLFGPNENQDNSTAVISYYAWKNQFAGQKDIIGEQMRLNGNSYTIIGVTAQEHYFFAPFDVYIPFDDQIVTAPDLTQRLIPIGKLPSSDSISEVNANVSRLTSSIEADYPDVYTYTHQYWAQPLHTAANATNEESTLVFTLFGLVAIAISVLGSVNLTNLFISRGLERQRELALRSAVGSSPLNLIGQSLVESFVICLIGACLGVALSYVSSIYIVHLTESMLDGLDASVPLAISLNTSAEEIIALVAIVVSIWLISSAVPIWNIRRQDTSSVLASSGKGKSDNARGNGNKIIICIQVICSCFLLVVCGCLVYAMTQLNNSNFGVKSKGLWTARVDLPNAVFDQNQKQDYLDRLRENLLSNSEIASTSFSTGIPGMMTVETRYGVNDRDIRSSNNSYPEASLVSVDKHFFNALNINLLEGRGFDDTDTVDTLPVAIVGEQFAKLYWPNESALGKRVQVNANADGEWATIIGVADRVMSNWPASFSPELIYRPILQTLPERFFISAKLPLEESDGYSILRDAANQTDPDMAFYRILTFDDHFYSLGAGAVLFAHMFLGIAIATAILAVLGIYGVISRNVLQRFTEIGVRRALGSSKQKVIWLYLRRSLVYVVIGSFFGGGAAMMIYETISMFLSTQAAAVPIIYLSVCFGLAAFVSLATYLPVRKVIRLDPGDALHQN